MKKKRSNESTTPRTVLLRLTRGASTQTTWLLRSSPTATTITIGSDASCDWEVQGRDVPGHAVSLALFDGGLFVASGPEAYVSIAGQRLPEVWQRVDRTASLEFGMAQIELVLEGHEERYGSERDRPTFPDGFSAGSDAHENMYTARTSWVDRFSRSSLLDTPSLLGRTQSRTNAQLLRYAGLLLFTALAYRAWLILLDRI